MTFLTNIIPYKDISDKNINNASVYTLHICQNLPHAPLCTFVIFSSRLQLAWTDEIFGQLWIIFFAFLERWISIEKSNHHSQIAMAKVGFPVRSTNRIIVVRAGFRAFCMIITIIKATKTKPSTFDTAMSKAAGRLDTFVICGLTNLVGKVLRK